MGYRVTASTGRPEEAAWLYKTVGVDEIINRSELSCPGKPLQKERWAAAIDTVGSHTLCNVCAGVRYGSIVAACGMAGDGTNGECGSVYPAWRHAERD